jgi:hypothetical protein
MIKVYDSKIITVANASPDILILRIRARDYANAANNFDIMNYYSQLFNWDNCSRLVENSFPFTNDSIYTHLFVYNVLKQNNLPPAKLSNVYNSKKCMA